MLRYSNRSIFGVMEPDPTFHRLATNNATDMEQFNQVLNELVDGLRSEAASGDSLKKYASGSKVGPSFQTIFALLQCTPDLTEQECSECLVGAINGISSCCAGKTGGMIVKPSCNLRFETSPFYDDSSTPDSQVPSPPPLTNTTSTQGTCYVMFWF